MFILDLAQNGQYPVPIEKLEAGFGVFQVDAQETPGQPLVACAQNKTVK
jgi:hypothetical protein